jgi:hypothetical protein
MEGTRRSRSWPSLVSKTGHAFARQNFSAGGPWTTLIDTDITKLVLGGSLSDSNNGLLWSYYGPERQKRISPEVARALAVYSSDIGSSFALSKYSSTQAWAQTNFTAKVGLGVVEGHGDVIPQGSHVSTFPVAPSLAADDVLNGWGATCIARCAPTNPLADAGTFLGELRQIPKIPGRDFYKSGLKGSGGEYLNVVFGWMPAWRDIKSFREANAKADEFLKNLETHSGKDIHREYTLLDTRDVTETTISANASSTLDLPGNPYRKNPLRRTTVTTERVWFSGVFRYLYQRTPEQKEFFRRIQDARDVYGLDLSVEVAWNLLPYSWLADWYGNIGDVAHNLTRFSQDGLTMRYGYIMRHKRIEYIYTYGPSSFTTVAEVKQRRRASPFGFGVNLANLSDRQWAILAALGQQKFLK